MFVELNTFYILPAPSLLFLKLIFIVTERAEVKMKVILTETITVIIMIWENSF